jgi:hypothetical protein
MKRRLRKQEWRLLERQFDPLDKDWTKVIVEALIEGKEK